MSKVATKESIVRAVISAVVGNARDTVYLTDENGHDLTNESYFSLTISKENGELVVKDVYPGQVYARIKIDVEF